MSVWRQGFDSEDRGGWLNVNVFCVQLHMLGDGSRGAVIEMTLAKVLYMSSKCHHSALITVVLSNHKKKNMSD